MFGLFNVVWYDGHDAFVSKFILEHNDGNITPSTMGKLENYINGNGEILKVDYRYAIDFDKIFEMNDKIAIDRFKEMYLKEGV